MTKTDKPKAKAAKPKTKPKAVAKLKPKQLAKAAAPTAASAAAPPVRPGSDVLDHLWRTVLSRRGADPAKSHSARLLSRGTAKVAQKFGEEAVECLIEAVAHNPEAVVAESADVLYHLIVLWVAAGIEPDEVWTELRRRESMSGIAEKAARQLGIHKSP